MRMSVLMVAATALLASCERRPTTAELETNLELLNSLYIMHVSSSIVNAEFLVVDLDSRMKHVEGAQKPIEHLRDLCNRRQELIAGKEKLLDGKPETLMVSPEYLELRAKADDICRK